MFGLEELESGEVVFLRRCCFNRPRKLKSVIQSSCFSIVFVSGQRCREGKDIF